MIKALLALSLLLLIPAASATSVLPLSLQQLSTRASTILYGEVIDNRSLRDAQSGQIVTLTTFRVKELIKGEISDPSGGTNTIKQLGGTLPAGSSGKQQRLMVHGVPAYTPGKDYVIFLPQKSSLGFSSPLGLHQGSLSVIHHDGQNLVHDAEQMVGNQSVDTAMHARTAVRPGKTDRQAQHRTPASSLADFISRVKAYNGH